ncbi:MAG: 30S ribosomal protein S20 [Ruminococcaceae bacterium]|nr:30S ribosomal protein S20 [Oscillospiraceae bacterium]
MPNIKSAKKRVKVIATKHMQNKIQKTEMKSSLKRLAAQISETKDANLLSEAYKTIDQAVAKGLLHRNTAARKKAQFAAMAK